VGVQLFVSAIFALYVMFVAQAVYDGIRDRMQFKTAPVMAAEIIGVIFAGAMVMAAGYGAIGAGIMLGGLLGLGSMNLIYATANPRRTRPSAASARHTM